MSELRQRQPRVENKKHLSFVRTVPCIICGRPDDSDAAHIRAPSLKYDKRLTGKGEKPSDCWTLPLCRVHHDEQHSSSEMLFWSRYGIDPFATATALFAATNDHETAMKIIQGAR